MTGVSADVVGNWRAGIVTALAGRTAEERATPARKIVNRTFIVEPFWHRLDVRLCLGDTSITLKPVSI
jgi:hypothetical protein